MDGVKTRPSGRTDPKKCLERHAHASLPALLWECTEFKSLGPWLDDISAHMRIQRAMVDDIWAKHPKTKQPKHRAKKENLWGYLFAYHVNHEGICAWTTDLAHRAWHSAQNILQKMDEFQRYPKLHRIRYQRIYIHHTYMNMNMYIYIYMCVCLFTYIYIYIYIFICLVMYLFECLSTYICINIYIYVYIFIYLFINLFACLMIYLSLYWFMHSKNS